MDEGYNTLDALTSVGQEMRVFFLPPGRRSANRVLTSA